MSVETLDDILSPGSFVKSPKSPKRENKVASALRNSPAGSSFSSSFQPQRHESEKPSFLSRAGEKLEEILKPREERNYTLETRANSSGRIHKYTPGSILNAAAEKAGEEKFSLKKAAWDAAKYAPVLGLQLAVFPYDAVRATMIPAIGLTLGSILENKKKKKPTTWNGLKKEFYTGNHIGFLDYYAFSLPEIVMNLTPGLWPAPALSFSLAKLPIQILRTALFESLVLPYNAAYHTFTYFRDKVGLGKTIGGLMTGKIFKYLKDSWTEQTKPNLWPDTKSVWKYLSPLHHFQINHLTSPELRMLQSVLINGPLYRYLMRDKSDEKKENKSFAYNPQSKLYVPSGEAKDSAGRNYYKDPDSGLYLPSSYQKNPGKPKRFRLPFASGGSDNSVMPYRNAA